MKLTRENAILPFPTDPELSGSLYARIVGLEDGVLVGCGPESTAILLGACIHQGALGEPASVAIMNGGLAGTVKLELNGPVTVGQYLVLDAAGVVSADPGSGARILVGQALEAGVASELIEAVIFKPIEFTE